MTTKPKFGKLVDEEDADSPQSPRQLSRQSLREISIAAVLEHKRADAAPAPQIIVATDEVPPALEESAGWFSKLFVSFVNPLFETAKVRPLEMTDLGGPYQQDQASRAHKWFDSQLHAARSAATAPGATFSYFRLLMNTITVKVFVTAVALRLVSATGSLLRPMIIRGLILYLLGTSAMSGTSAWLLALSLLVIPVVQALIDHKVDVYLLHASVQLRKAIACAIYESAQRLTPEARQAASRGHIMTLMSTDANKMQILVSNSSRFMTLPVLVVIGTALLLSQLGVASFAGIALLVLCFPISGKVMATVRVLHGAVMELVDERVKVTNETLQGISIIKYYGWERAFQAVIEKIREAELVLLRKQVFVFSTGVQVFMSFVNNLMSIAVFFTYTQLMGVPLDPASAFSSLVLFQIIQSNFLRIPMAAVNQLHAFHSFKRVVNFCLLPQTSREEDESRRVPKEGAPYAVMVDDITAHWAKLDIPWAAAEKGDKGKAPAAPIHPLPEIRASSFELSHCTLNVAAGECIAIVGPVGAGKSSLISAILGDMRVSSGSVAVAGQVAYVSQRPWVANATIRDNVLFGLPYDEQWYHTVVDACALDVDIAVLPGAHDCEVGEKGINLSGGQKARLALARAAYSRPDVIILDDVLAAVDAHVGEHLFRRCIQGILRPATRIMAMNQVQFLPSVDRIAVMDQGHITSLGSYAQLTQSGIAFASFGQSVASPGVASGPPEEPVKPGKKGKKNKDDAEKGKLVKVENRSQGIIQTAVYRYYLQAAGIAGWVGIVSVFLAQVVGSISSFVLGAWSAKSIQTHTTEPAYLLAYCMMGLLTVIVTAVSSYSTGCAVVLAGRVLHSRLLNRILNAPMSFFDVTPTGRIINRFSQDVHHVDLDAGRALVALLTAVLSLIVTLLTIGLASYGIMLIVLAPIIFLYWRILVYVRLGMLEAERLQAVSRSPLFAYFSETLAGLSTIRAFDKQQEYFDRHCNMQDTATVAFLTKRHMESWLTVRLSLLAAVVSGCVASVALLITGIPVAFTAVGLTYAMSVTDRLTAVVESLTMAESSMNSVDRMRDYCETVPQEGTDDPVTVPLDWPTRGQIEFRNLAVRYRQNPPVLHDVQVTVNEREKMGVAGRTGSGKSTLIAGLFRIVPAFTGTIFIDGVDISTVDLTTLRQRLGIIPQDPVLFAGTLRYNLDPFDSYADSQIWNALDKAQLGPTVRSWPTGLSYQVSEGGENLSVGQRQLVCLARVILRNPRILVLDEATGSVDMATDEAVQKMIRGTFEQSTVLTVAHRLHTIMDYDRVLVLDAGRVIECAAPLQLLQTPNSAFKSMAEAAGLTQYDEM